MPGMCEAPKQIPNTTREQVNRQLGFTEMRKCHSGKCWQVPLLVTCSAPSRPPAAPSSQLQHLSPPMLALTLGPTVFTATLVAFTSVISSPSHLAWGLVTGRVGTERLRKACGAPGELSCQTKTSLAR